MLIEGGVLAAAGGVIGAGGGLLYTRAMLSGLASVWSSAVADSTIRFHANFSTVAIGLAAGFVASLLCIWLTVRRQGRRPVRELLATNVDPGSGAVSSARSHASWGWWTGAACLIGALGMLWRALIGGEALAAGSFFGVGSLLLVAGLALCWALLGAAGRSSRARRLKFSGLGWRNATRRAGRSLAVVCLLACGCFLVVAVGANRQDPARNAGERFSGTGGFALIGQSALPLFGDLNTQEGREKYGLDGPLMQDVRFVLMRARAGDDASCLNLNRAQVPRLLGVRAEELGERGAFTFAGTLQEVTGNNGWSLLYGAAPEEYVPAVADNDTIVWALGKSLGDTLTYTGERGETFRVRFVGALAGSVLQGNIIISEDAFVEHFPSEGGHRMMLVDAPSVSAASVSKTLGRAMADEGLELTPAAARLRSFYELKSSYLSIFQLLGGMGLILGSVGLGVVVLRNVLERRGELALLRAVGFRRASIVWIVLLEHWGLLLVGLLCGVCSAVVAVMPALMSSGADVPYVSLSATLAGVMMSALVWILLAAMWALHGPLLDALRNE